MITITLEYYHDKALKRGAHSVLLYKNGNLFKAKSYNTRTFAQDAILWFKGFYDALGIPCTIKNEAGP